MTAAVITSLAQKSKWNPCGSTPSLISETFEYESNSFVFYNEEHKVFVYFKVKGLTKNIEEDMGKQRKISILQDLPPVLIDGYLLLTKKRVIRAPASHLLKRQVLSLNAITYKEFSDEFLGKYTSTKSSRRNSTAASQDAGVSEREAADLVMEDQIEALFFARDSQALGRLSDIAHTKRAIKKSAAGDPEGITEQF
ncbi:MAG TPA: hypothetical protein VFM18_23810 [Methanosarcina sp.]|nr:hypothetical protein [Methanosarcina sp.]